MDAVSIGFSIICVFVGTLWSSLFSIYASRVVNQIEGIGEAAYFTKWYDLPPTLQKYMILIIARSQEEINFAGMGIIYCNLETFGKVNFHEWTVDTVFYFLAIFSIFSYLAACKLSNFVLFGL